MSVGLFFVGEEEIGPPKFGWVCQGQVSYSSTHVVVFQTTICPLFSECDLNGIFHLDIIDT